MWKFLTASLVMAIALVLTAGNQVSANTPKPGSPTNLQVSAGDTEATITWDAPAAGSCAAVDYQVWVEEISDVERIGGNEVTSPWTATGLKPSTNYAVSVYTYGAMCDDYSAEPAEATFRTMAADGNDAAATNPTHSPKRVKRLRATDGNNGVNLTWTAPNTKNGKHHAATAYAVEIYTISGGEKTYLKTIYDITNTSAMVTGLSSGTYRFAVAAYSKDCNCWGKWRKVRHTYEGDEEEVNN